MGLGQIDKLARMSSMPALSRMITVALRDLEISCCFIKSPRTSIHSSSRTSLRRSSQRATGRTAKRSKCCSSRLLQRCNNKNLFRDIKQEISENIGEDVTTNLCPGISSFSKRNTENIKKKQKNIWKTISAERFLMEDVLSILITDSMEVMCVIFSETKNSKAYHQMYLFLCNKL